MYIGRLQKREKQRKGKEKYWKSKSTYKGQEIEKTFFFPF